MQKIYEIEFRNTKYWGETNKRLQVQAGSLTFALKLALAEVRRSEEFSGKANWIAVRAEQIAETIN